MVSSGALHEHLLAVERADRHASRRRPRSIRAAPRRPRIASNVSVHGSGARDARARLAGDRADGRLDRAGLFRRGRRRA